MRLVGVAARLARTFSSSTNRSYLCGASVVRGP
jgi:hypothetical protein